MRPFRGCGYEARSGRRAEPSNTNGTVSVTGGNVTLNASTSGSLQGIAIWKDSTTLNTASITGGNFTVGGIIYMPATVLTYTGGNTPVQQTIVVDQIQMTGGQYQQALELALLLERGVRIG